jgi:asparagine synthetase B (glutamine-hydrolysing)
LLWLASENFIRTDKIFMSQSIELRSPLAYHPLRVHFDTRLSPQQYHTASQNKCYLRARYADKLPPYIIARARKSGWKTPIADWYDADIKAFFLSLLPPDTASHGVVDWPALKRDMERTREWPGKYMHLYLSLAILADYYGMAI